MVKPAFFMIRPRYLRAIPSLMVLTTAIAWGVASGPDVTDSLDDKPGSKLVQRAQGLAGTARLEMPVNLSASTKPLAES